MSTAFDLAERGAALAAEHADREHCGWTEQALEAFKTYAATHSQFTTEDVVAAAVAVPVPPEKRAWGQVALLAKKQGVIIKAGFCTAKMTQAHCRPVSLWQSLICAPALAGA
jgi:hypothetical protein